MCIIKYMFKYIENILPPKYADRIESELLSTAFNWNFNKHTADPSQNNFANKNILDTEQFTFKFYDADMFNPISDRKLDFMIPMQYIFEEKFSIDISHCVRIKANLLLQKKEFIDSNYNMPHVDLVSHEGFKALSILYYVNDSDGDTVFFNEHAKDNPAYLTEYKRLSPKKNSAVIFDSDRLHASCNPIKNNYRCVINFITEVVLAS